MPLSQVSTALRLLRRSLLRGGQLGLLLLAGCFVPIPGVPDRAPYADASGWLVDGRTTRMAVEALLGTPPIIRSNGRLVIYGAARETAARLLALTIIPATIPLEEFHFLILEFDVADVLRYHEVVIRAQTGAGDPPCDSRGYCLLWVDWETEGMFPLWLSSGDIKRGGQALVSASRDAAARARQLTAPPDGCVVVFWTRDGTTRWTDDLLARFPGTVTFELDAHRPFTERMGHRMFTAWQVSEGAHALTASDGRGRPVANLPLDCVDGSVFAIEATVLPTFGGLRPQVRFEHVMPAAATAAIADRYLLLEE
ncbi:MAG: hypothetical protein R3E84_04895 [Pseudomonadales bacterium]